MPEWEDLRYEDIKHALDPRLRELHEQIRALLEERARAREPGLTHGEYERRIDAIIEQRRRERAAARRDNS